MVKLTQTIRRQFADNLPMNCLSVFDHFVGLALKWLTLSVAQCVSVREKMTENKGFFSFHFLYNIQMTRK